MKKQLVLIFAVLLILGFAVDVYAQTPAVANGDTQITISGEMRFRGRVETRTDTFGGATDEENKDTNQRARYDTKMRLGILAKVSPKTKAFIQLSSGAATNNHSYTWDSDHNTAKGGYTYGNGMQSGLYIRNVWLEHTIADLITIKAGHQPIKLGWGIFYDHSLYGDDAIVVTVKPTKELSISALTAKLNEAGFDADDADLYSAAVNYVPMKGTEISFDATYLRDRQMDNSFGTTTSLGDNLTGSQYRLGLWNFGGRAKTKIADLGLRLGVEIQRGTLKDVTGVRSDVKFKGLAAQLGASYDIKPVTLDLELGYGSGDDNGTSDGKVKTFVTSKSANTPLTFVYEDETVTSANQTPGGTSNLMYAKIGAKADLTKDFNADLRVYYLKAAKAPKSSVSAERYRFAYASDKKDIGVEVDLYTKYKLDKGLIYFLEGGYLFAGDYWKAVTNTQSPKDPWAIKHGLELEF